MIDVLKTKYDFIVGIGPDCACSSYLRRCNLQFKSYPFDWLTRAPFENRIELILNNFSNFLNFEDLKFMEKPTDQGVDEKCDYYENINNQFYFYHDFPIGVPLETSLPLIQEKYNRRIKRFYDKIEQSENTLIVWFDREQINEETLVEGMTKILEKFPRKNINMLVIEPKETKTFEYNQLHPNILKIAYDNMTYANHKRWNVVMGHEKNNMHIFKKLKLNLTLKQKLKQLIYLFKLFLIKFIIIKNIRYKLRDKVMKEYNHAAL